MRINVAALKKAGVNVRMFERVGKGREELAMDVLNGTIIEITVEGGAPLPDSVTEAINELLPPRFAQPVVDELYKQIHTFQVVAAINDTEDK